jgi:hypothetical protein
MATPTTPPPDSFRVPNSVIQGLTTNTSSDLNRLSAFQMVTLLGLLTRVTPKAPQKEVTMRLSEILEIIEVGKQVAHAVDREWETAAGARIKRRYKCHRFSPTHLQQVHEALLALYDTSVAIQRWDKKQQHRLDDRQVHVLDMFGYTYQRDGKMLDLDNLPPDSRRVNVNSDERPVWRVCRQREDGDRYDRPSGIVFRLNTELANELARKQGTVGFTIIARKVFGLLKRYMRQPAVIRLIVLILRQTGNEFSRNLKQVLGNLGFDTTHPARAIQDLKQALAQLQRLRLVTDYTVDVDADTLVVVRNSDWHREEVALL